MNLKIDKKTKKQKQDYSLPLAKIRKIEIGRGKVEWRKRVGQDKNTSSIYPHFPVGSLFFSSIFFFHFFPVILVFRLVRPPGKAMDTPHKERGRERIRQVGETWISDFLVT